MKAFGNFMLLATVSVMFFSCQKELSIDRSGSDGNPDENNGNTSIIGDWSFVAADMDVAVAGEATDITLGNVKFTNAFKTTTLNNKGSLKFTSTDFQSTNLSYSVSTNIQVITTIPGFPPDVESIPFNFDMPASNSSGKYQQIGNDSLYFPDGTFISVPEASGGVPSSVSGGPGGARFSIVSDTLKIFGGIDTTSVEQVQGLLFSVKQKSSVVLKYKKK